MTPDELRVREAGFVAVPKDKAVLAEAKLKELQSQMAELLEAAKVAEKFIYDGLHGDGISALAGEVTLKALKQAIAKAEGK